MTPAELAEMGRIVEQELGDLPANLHKFLRAGMRLLHLFEPRTPLSSL